MVKPGERYLSKRWLHYRTNQPLVMKITKVAAGSIYYRPDYGKHDDGSEWLGSPARIDATPEAIERWLGKKVEAASTFPTADVSGRLEVKMTQTVADAGEPGVDYFDVDRARDDAEAAQVDQDERDGWASDDPDYGD